MLLLVLPSGVFAQSVFSSLTEKLQGMGFFEILLFLLFSIIFFALLARSKVLGGNAIINGFVALAISFLIFVYPVFTGFSLVEPMSRFFTQLSVIAMLLVFAVVLSSVFYPDMVKMMVEYFTKPNMISLMIILVLVLLIISRTIWTFWAGLKISPTGSSSDMVIIIVALLIFIVILYVAASIGGKK
jgi:hypothetical protein